MVKSALKVTPVWCLGERIKILALFFTPSNSPRKRGEDACVGCTV
jgi:hypothetical protein